MTVLQPGTQLKRGTFVIGAELGRGGFGEVYVARQPRMDRDVAIKVLLPRVAEDPHVVERFQREALAAGALLHPNVLPVFDFDFDEEAEVWYLVMQFVPGGRTLADHRHGLLPAEEVVRLVAAVGGALDAAHNRGIVHRDVKPANVLLDGDRPLLTDFGIARLGEMVSLTTAGMAIGTPTYMSPEQALGRGVGPESDQYSLAVMTYELMAGRPPFTGDLMSVVAQQVSARPPSLVAFNPAATAEVEAAIDRALSKVTENRYPSCMAFAEALLEATHNASLRRPVVSGATSGTQLVASADLEAASSHSSGTVVQASAEDVLLPPSSGTVVQPSVEASGASARSAPRYPLLAAAAGSVVAVAVVMLFVAHAFLGGTGAPAASPTVGPSATASAIGSPVAVAPVASSPRGEVTVTSSPDGAGVLVDGESAGRTTLALSLVPGGHDVTVAFPSYRPYTQHIDIEDGDQVAIPANLDPLPAANALAVTDQALGRNPFLDASGYIRVRTPVDTFRLSDDVDLVVYYHSSAYQVRDMSFAVSFRMQSGDGPAVERQVGTQVVPSSDQDSFTHICAPAASLDALGSGAPLTLDLLLDEQQVAEFNMSVAGGNPADAPPNGCSAPVLPQTTALGEAPIRG